MEYLLRARYPMDPSMTGPHSVSRYPTASSLALPSPGSARMADARSAPAPSMDTTM